MDGSGSARGAHDRELARPAIGCSARSEAVSISVPVQSANPIEADLIETEPVEPYVRSQLAADWHPELPAHDQRAGLPHRQRTLPERGDRRGGRTAIADPGDRAQDRLWRVARQARRGAADRPPVECRSVPITPAAPP